jgi:hypothetical protein
MLRSWTLGSGCHPAFASLLARSVSRAMHHCGAIALRGGQGMHCKEARSRIARHALMTLNHLSSFRSEWAKCEMCWCAWSLSQSARSQILVKVMICLQ